MAHKTTAERLVMLQRVLDGEKPSSVAASEAVPHSTLLRWMQAAGIVRRNVYALLSGKLLVPESWQSPAAQSLKERRLAKKPIHHYYSLSKSQELHK